MSIIGLGYKLIKLLIPILVLGGIFLVLLNLFNVNSNTPESVTKKFISLSKNPTDVVSKNEKNTISQITEQKFLQNIKYESLIKQARQIDRQYPNSKYKVEAQENSPYSISSIQYFDGNGNFSIEIKLFMESYKTSFYLPKQTKIFHIEIIGSQLNIDKDLTSKLEENVSNIKSKLDEGVDFFNKKIKLNF